MPQVFLRNRRTFLEVPSAFPSGLIELNVPVPASGQLEGRTTRMPEKRPMVIGNQSCLPHADKQKSKGRDFLYHQIHLLLLMFRFHYLPVWLDTTGLKLVKTHEKLCSLRFSSWCLNLPKLQNEKWNDEFVQFRFIHFSHYTSVTFSLMLVYIYVDFYEDFPYILLTMNR